MHHFGNVVEKAQVQHAVGFVQHQGMHTVQTERLALQMIKDAAWRAHYDICTMLQTQGLPP